MSFSLSDNEKKILLKTARITIENTFQTPKKPLPQPTENLQEYCGAFVTLHRKGKLRGCIGNMTGIKPLFETIIQMAESSAFHDPRFTPVAAHEVEELDIEISVLTPLREIEDVEEIEVGKHGIYMQRGHRSGVLLPQVSVEQGWDRNTFLEHTCMKAGMTTDCWQDPEVKISVFEAIIFRDTELRPSN